MVSNRSDTTRVHRDTKAVLLLALMWFPKIKYCLVPILVSMGVLQSRNVLQSLQGSRYHGPRFDNSEPEKACLRLERFRVILGS